MLVTTRSTRIAPITGPAARVAEERDEQRHAHEAGVRKGGDEGAEGGVAQDDAIAAARAAPSPRSSWR